MQNATAQLGILAPLFRWAALLTRPREVAVADPRCPHCAATLQSPWASGRRCPHCDSRVYVVMGQGARPSLGTRRQAKAREAERMLERQRTQAAYKVHINMSALKSGFET